MPEGNSVTTLPVFCGDLRSFTFVKEPQNRSDLETANPGFYGKSGDQEFFLPLSLLSDNAQRLLQQASDGDSLSGFEGARIRYKGGRLSHPPADGTYPREFGFEPNL